MLLLFKSCHKDKNNYSEFTILIGDSHAQLRNKRTIFSHFFGLRLENRQHDVLSSFRRRAGPLLRALGDFAAGDFSAGNFAGGNLEWRHYAETTFVPRKFRREAVLICWQLLVRNFPRRTFCLTKFSPCGHFALECFVTSYFMRCCKWEIGAN